MPHPLHRRASIALTALVVTALGVLALPGASVSPGATVVGETRGRSVLDTPQAAQGKLLIARRELPDPNFAEAVVLLIQLDERGAMGLIVNRLTEGSLATVLPGLENARIRRAPILSGGPVDRSAIMMLLRADSEPRESRRVFADVWVSRSRATLEDLPEDVDVRATLRVYSGYAGWAPGQLEAELERGDWHVVDADPGIVFHPSPRSLWHKLLPREPAEVALETSTGRGKPSDGPPRGG